MKSLGRNAVTDDGGFDGGCQGIFLKFNLIKLVDS
jgi:hypothetical protein